MNRTLMVAPDRDRLFELLPALYRIADEQGTGSLKALLALITERADSLRADSVQLWDDAFIETCRRSIIPYLGDLVGNIPLHDLDLTDDALTAEALFTDLAGPGLTPPREIRLRADVAKTIYYRRRKGTPAMLEELARDVTGWGARVVEMFTRLDWNQHLEHLRPEAPGCPELRQLDVGDRAGGPWDETTHTVDVRRINEWDGWHNIHNLAFYLWRLRAFRLTEITPRAIGGSLWRLTFSPLGCDTPLFSSGRRERGASRMATEPTIEGPIRAVGFFDDLRPVPPATAPALAYYGNPTVSEGSVVVLADGIAVLPSDITSVNLGQWQGLVQPTGTKLGIDITRGRLIVPTGRSGQTITVSYFHGFSAPMGGGEYERARWLVPSPAPTPVSGGGADLQVKINARVGTRTVLTISDSARYDITDNLTLAAGESLTIQAADQARPHLRVRRPDGTWEIFTAGKGAALTLNGLLVEGALLVRDDLATLRVLHSTLVPGRSVEQEAAGGPAGPSLVVAASSSRNTQLDVQIAFSIVGGLRLPAHVDKLWLLDSIVDGHENGVAVAGFSPTEDGPAAHIERSTLLGSSRFRKLPLASESIFSGEVRVEEHQAGCVRFSYVPPGSRTPQQYLCQPAREIAAAKARKQAEAQRAGVTLPPGWEQALRTEIERWLVPSFETDRYGRPDYAQLRRTCPGQLRTGAADGSEMGAFSFLKQAQREANLRTRLDEYLPVGIEAGLIYVT